MVRRSRLASASVLIPSVHGPEKGHSNVIPLICSIFLANQGASEAVGEGESLPWVSKISLELDGPIECKICSDLGHIIRICSEVIILI